MAKKREAGATSTVATTRTGRIVDHDIEQELKTSFLNYSMSVITARALPDVRDGLKPVHRRVLFAMNDLGLVPGRPYKKSATVVGDVLGKYHPHGDTSVYDALVRLAQTFAMAHPLVDGQGNFGSIDGDRAAAYRYTEARMTEVAAEMLDELEQETVDMQPTFDDRRMEAVVLPSRFPNFLVNGGEGIAVGMATKSPPHNLREIAAALELLCDDPETADERVIAKVKGPDFPTGGLLMASPEIKTFYRTGRGKMTLRATSHVERTRTGRSALVFTEIPFGVTKAKLIDDIAELVREHARTRGADKDTGKRTRSKAAELAWADWVDKLRDESDREGIRVVVELKRDVKPEVVLQALYAKTGLSMAYNALMLALVDGQPEVLTLRRALDLFIAHRLAVIVRRSRWALAKAEARVHVIDGLLVAIQHIDRVVAIIKTSADRAHAHRGLRAAFALSEHQADAILDLRLARLTALDVGALTQERADLVAQIADLTALLASPERQRRVVRDETQAVATRFGLPRRTKIVAPAEADHVATTAVDTVTTLALSVLGQVRIVPEGGKLRARPTDPVRATIALRADDVAVLFTDTGRAYPLMAHEAIDGASLQRAVDGLGAKERVLHVMAPEALRSKASVVFVLRNGMVKRIAASEFAQVRRGGVQATTLAPDDALVAVLDVPDAADLALVTGQGKALRCAVADIPQQGRAARGVAGVKLADGDQLAGATRAAGDVVVVTQRGAARRYALADLPRQKRGGQGVQLAKCTAATGPIVACLGDPTCDLVVMSGGRAERVAGTAAARGARGATPTRLATLPDGPFVGGPVVPRDG